MTPLTGWSEPPSAGFDREVVELRLLLPRWQADALDAAARERGMTTGQLLRRVITDLFVDAPPDRR